VRATAYALIALAWLMAPAAAQQTWPSAKPVRIIAPFAPGGVADLFGRILAPHFSEVFGQQFLVENRAGAGGLVGSELVARAPPDGYTLIISGVASHVLAPAVNPNHSFDPIADFTHIALLGGPPGVLVVNPALPARSLAEFIALARNSPAPLTYGSPGIGSQGHINSEYLQQVTGITLTHVPYRSAGQIVTDLLANHVSVALNALTSSAEQILTGGLRALAVTSRQRLTEFPNIPTFVEEGYPDLVTTTWFSLSGPANLPPDIVARLNAEAIRALQQPEIRKRLQRDAIDPEPLDPAQFTAFIKAEVARWIPIVKATGAKPD
jgi:tripartite-type tricarboxylate transporter receptor subunit TctC